jgi:hypothetical protein
MRLDRPGLVPYCARMFDLDQFIADCRAAVAADKSHKKVREV